MNISGQKSEKTKRIENICSSLRARAHLPTKFTETANIEKGVLGAQNTVENFTFPDHGELKVNMGQTACSEKTARCHTISSETGATSESSSNDEPTTNNKGSRPFQCLECGKSFTKQTYLNRHQKIHHEQPQDQNHATHLSRLDSCNFKSSDIARKPVSLEHNGITAENRSYLISLQVEPSNCVRGIEEKENLKMKRFTCGVCQKTFKKNRYLKIHMRIHIGEKPYVCEVCNKSFLQLCQLTQHAVIHTGEKPYKCKVCNKSFSHLTSLTRHVRIHTGEKPYKCELCNKTFAAPSSLTDHVRIHTREKPYKCEVCNKTFASRSGLYRHKFSHMENSFKCDKCNKTFSYKHNLRRHLRDHPKYFE